MTPFAISSIIPVIIQPNIRAMMAQVVERYRLRVSMSLASAACLIRRIRSTTRTDTASGKTKTRPTIKTRRKSVARRKMIAEMAPKMRATRR